MPTEEESRATSNLVWRDGLGDSGVHTLGDTSAFVNPTGQLLLIAIKGALYRIWCGVNRLGDSGVNRLGDSLVPNCCA